MFRTLVSFLLMIFPAFVVAAGKPNVLFIAVDDLRPQLNCYGQTNMVTPNIDRLAASGTLFERAYCMVPTCGASRASLMTGIRPSQNRFVNYLTRASVDAPGITTMNTHFKEHGYYTVSMGKVFHHLDDHADGWCEPAIRASGKAYHTLESIKIAARANKQNGRRKRGPAYESADAPEADYVDGNLAEIAQSKLKDLSTKDQPFFFAVGFVKPHLPFVCPQKYWDLYDHDEIQLPENYSRPIDAPDVAIHNSGELRAYAGIPAKGPVSDETARNLIHGYYACVSFVDAQIGKVLTSLEEFGLAENTIVVLWGDHGWNLGEHTLWCKHSCFETSMQIPIIIRAPQVKGQQRAQALVETIDLYPTLCELTGLPTPEHLDGSSLLRILHDPDHAWDKPAIGRFQSGDTIRTDNYRYTSYSAKGGKSTAKMLYDHITDPDENQNVVKAESHQQIAKELDRQLQSRKGKNDDHDLK